MAKMSIWRRFQTVWFKVFSVRSLPYLSNSQAYNLQTENDPRPEPVKKSSSHSEKKVARQNSSKLSSKITSAQEKEKDKEKEKEKTVKIAAPSDKEKEKEKEKAAKIAARDKKKSVSISGTILRCEYWQVSHWWQEQVSAKQWAISSAHRKKYKAVFKQHNKNGFITGQQALVLFGASKLPNEMLAQIWYVIFAIACSLPN